MKNLLTLYVLIFLFNSDAFGTVFSILAQKQDLYSYINTLRNHSYNNLDEVLHEMHLEVRNLRTQNRFVKADYMQDLYQQIYYTYVDRIDKAFNDLDQMIVLDGGKLDFYDALDKQKLKLIDEIRLEARRVVIPLIRIPFSELRRSYGLHSQKLIR